MPGEAKRKYQGENVRIAKSMNRPLSLIVETLKPGYIEKDLLEAYKRYYPFEWYQLRERYEIYKAKDRFLKKCHKKKRYNPLSPEEFFHELQKVKYLTSKGFRAKHEAAYNEELRQQLENEFVKKRCLKVEAKRAEIEKNTMNQQEIDPGFIDALIFAYHKKGNNVNAKLEICREIQKYDCDKTWKFFSKLNDSERNDEIRHLAFSVLQNSGHYVKLRKNFKGKKKPYMKEKSSLVGTPEALAVELSIDDSIQNIKSYDLFISHSLKDSDKVRRIVSLANQAGLSCYVDWTADNDFLKRSMVSEYTVEVLKARMRQSRNLLFLSSENSRQSKWVSFELDYYQKNVGRKIYMIVLNGIDEHGFLEIDENQLEELNGK